MKRAIPPAVLENHVANLGKTGSGKTSTAKLMIEQVVADNHRVVVFDPIKSDYWGLTSSADGKHAGLPFTILGGPRGHVPLHDGAGKAMAELVASGALPLSIMDMADFPPGGHQRFFIDFCQTLLKKIKGVVYFVIDEAHLFAPKEKGGVGNEMMSIHWFKTLATAGRSKGIRFIVVTQRTQALHNAVLGSCDTLYAHRLTLPADQLAVEKWLKTNADKAVADTIKDSLASLATGEAWMVSGEANIGAKRVQLPRIATYDNTTTPTGKGKEHRVTTASIDVDKLRETVGEAVAEAAANDPKALKEANKKLAADKAALQRQLDAAKAKPQAAATPVVDRAALDESYAAGLWDGLHSFVGLFKSVDDIHSRAIAVVSGIEKVIGNCQLAYDASPAHAHKPRNHQRVKIPKSGSAAVQRIAVDAPMRSEASGHKPVAARAPSPAMPKGDGSITGPQLQVLTALAWWERAANFAPTRAQVCAICKWKTTSGHIKNVASSLKTAGLVDYPNQGALALTEVGRSVAPTPDHNQTLLESARATLTGPQLLVFNALPKNGDAMTRNEVCAALGWEASSGHIKNIASSLKTLSFVKYPSQGSLAREDWLAE